MKKTFLFLGIFLIAACSKFMTVTVDSGGKHPNPKRYGDALTLGKVPMGVGTKLNVAFPIINLAIDQVNTNTATILLRGGGIYNVKEYGALGDGSNDDAQEIQAACDAAYAAGGGIVYVPAGHYKVSTAIKVKDNVKLIGQGINSWIENTVTTATFPFTCPVLTGNFGDYATSTGLLAEPSYPIKRVLSGDTIVTFKHSANASTFVVGDIVLLTSHEKWGALLGAPHDSSVYVNLNVIIWKSTDKIKLMYPVKDSLSVLIGDPRIRRLSGTINGYDGTPLWAAKNAEVSNLRLTQTNPYYDAYMVFANGVNNTYENLYMDKVSSLFGSNGLSHSVIRNIQGTYNFNAGDFCDFQNDNLIENYTAKRYSSYSRQSGSLFGFALIYGADCTVRNLNIDLSGIGNVHFLSMIRGTIENSFITNANLYGIDVGFGQDCIVRNNVIRNIKGSGVYSFSDRVRIIGNTIQNIGLNGSPAASIYVQITEGYSWPTHDYTITDNLLGTYGARTTNDRIATYPGFLAPTPALGTVQNNIPSTMNVGASNIVNTVSKTLGWPGATGVDFKFTSADNTTNQYIDLGNIIPAKARIIDVEMMCDEDVTGTGGNPFSLRAGNTSGGEEFITEYMLYGNWTVLGTSDPTKLAAVGVNYHSATNVFVGGAGDSKFNQLTSGKWTIYVTYIQY